ncbi:hypothetical protein BK015_25095 [Burkholderia pseudomallei]|uniref:gp53-like domain-containing protein n=1 Tax=Burkholderia pseudomallei TaxID=28450 RepID=UPI0008FF4908|nr:hypothetical protein [Burkholderia pseudomallei]APD38432.1 hypothetical protein BK015_25095 [Burkholderia pseudomallei]
MQVYEWLFSAQAQNNMTAMAKVCAALFGTGGIANGLPCTPTSPATMTVQIGAGEIYQMENLEATACGTLPADTSHTILKQGIQLGTYTTATFAAPGSSGQSINYLIEAQYQDSDISLDPTTGVAPVVLQFYNSSNPATPWSGPNNSGATSNTFRDGVIAYQIKSGVAATTGSQVTPSPDTGWIGLWVVTVAYGQSTIVAGNIAQYSGAPILSADLLTQIGARALLAGSSTQTFSVANATAAAHAVNLGQFASSLSTSGYLKLPGGPILQWGVGTLPNSGARTSSVTVTLPIAWPSSTLLSATANANGAANSSVGGLPVVGATSNTSSSITFTADTLGYTTFNQTMTFLWFALGK